MRTYILFVFLSVVLVAIALSFAMRNAVIGGGFEMFETGLKSEVGLPNNIKGLKNKVSYIKSKILKPIPYEIPTKPANKKLPDGLCIITGPFADSDVDKLHSNFEYIFGNLKKLGLRHNYNKLHGNTFLFDKSSSQNWDNAISELRRVNPSTAELMTKLINHICARLDIPADVVHDQLRTTIIKYEQNKGIKLHLDSIRRTSGGPIITMNIGPDHIYYDLVSVRDDRDDPSYRIRVDKNEMVVMDGDARLHYAHALPYGFHYNKTKYTIVLLFDKFRIIDRKYSKYFNANITKSVRC